MNAFWNTWCKDGKAAAEYCLEFFPEDKVDTIRRADNACRKSFLFDKRWEMERTWVPVVFENEIDWEHRPDDDPEWTYAFNRHTFLLDLAKAYVYTNDDKYAETAVQYLSDFIDRIRPNDDTRKTAWRPIEAGIRCENWLKTLALLNSSNAFATSLQKIDSCLRVHADELMESHSDFQRLSNWGVLQDHGLFLLGAYFGEQKYIDLSLRRLSENLSLQVLPDGVQWEQSPMYHGEVLHCFLEVVSCAARMGIELPDGFCDTVERMSLALGLWGKPNGHLVCQSDSDDIDARDLLAEAAVIFESPELKFLSGDSVCHELLWTKGREAVAQYEALPSKQPTSASIALAESGNYMLRDKWGEDGNYLHLHCGSLGSGHGHADILHIDLFAHGEDILVDGGRYTYVDNADRKYLKSGTAHNTILVDEEEFSPYKSSWSYERLAQPVKGEYRFGENADFISGSHLGYIQSGVFVTRKVVYLKPSVYIIVDEMFTGQKHSYERKFHFSYKGDVRLDGSTVEYLGQRAKAKMIFLDNDSKLTLVDSPQSLYYNKLEKGMAISARNEGDGFRSMITVISTAAASETLDFHAERVPVTLIKSGREIPPSLAAGIRILLGDDEYYAIVCHGEIIDEVDLLSVNGYSGYGKVLVFGKNFAETLAW